MRMSNSPLYQSINKISDPSIRSMVYYFVDKNWTKFYNKPIVTEYIRNKKGFNACYDLLEECWFFGNNMGLSVKDKDRLLVLAIMEKAWLGDVISNRKKTGWKYLKTSQVWRDPDWKQGSSRFLNYVSEICEKFGVSDLWPDFKLVYDEKWDYDDTIYLYRVSYISVNKR